MSSRAEGAGSARLEVSGFAKVLVPAREVQEVLEMMKVRIRRISHIEKSSPADLAEVSRLARMCFLLVSADHGENVFLGRMSSEDIDAAYVLPHDARTESFLAGLNTVRGKARSSGLIDPEVADRAAKSVFDVMEG